MPHRPRPLLPMLFGIVLILDCSAPDPKKEVDKARQLRLEGRADEAVKALESLQGKMARNGALQYELALSLHALGRDQESLDAATRAVEADPRSAGAHMLRGELLGALGREPEALDELRRVAIQDQAFPGIHRALGMVHARAGRLDQAVKQYEKELEAHPDDAETLTEIGIYYFRTAKLSDAADRLERAVALAPSVRALRSLAEVRFKQYRGKEGLALQEKALALAPDDLDLLLDHARAIGNYGDPEASRRLLQSAVDRGVADARVNVELGKMARARLANDEAIAHYRRAIALEPGLPEAHFNLGKILMYMGRRDEALAAFREASRLAPSDPYAYYYIGAILADQGQLDEAITLFRRSLGLDDLNPMAHYALARALQRTGKTQEAQAEFSRHAGILRTLRERRQAGVATAD